MDDREIPRSFLAGFSSWGNPGTSLLIIALTLLVGQQLLWGSVTGSISGVVRDTSGAVIPGAEVVALNVQTGVQWRLVTDTQGFYSFQALPIGTYEVDVSKEGFQSYRQTGLVLTVNAALTVDVSAQVGAVVQRLTVSSTAVHVDTASTQMGEVIGSNKITSVPLVTRGYTDLLALQPGVVPVSSGMAGGQGGEFTATGFGIAPVSGDLNAGNLSVNGMRESSNGFLLNGATVQESGFSGTAIIPNLDSIAEFRILTNNFDAEYGAYAGGQINVITKSGTDRFHGDMFEFVRNTDLEARNFYDINRGAYQQNQFGGTIGGPIKRNKLFFFADYQGNRVVQGQSTGQVTVPSAAERQGDFSALTTCTPGGSCSNPMTGTVQGPAWASNLSTLLGYPVTQGERYYTPGCTSSAACVFPNAQIPQAAWTTPSKNILQYIPQANSGQFFVSSGAASRLRDDKGSGRLDANTGIGMVSGYYYYDKYYSSNLNPTAPLFGGGSTVGSDVVNLGLTKSLGSSAVNEARIAYTRLNIFNHPSGGAPYGLNVLSSLGFPVGPGALGPFPVQPAWAGVPNLNFNDFSLGGGGVGGIVEGTYQGLDNFSKVFGTHTMKFGGMVRFNQQTQYNLGSNGAYTFNGSETGIDFADYLIGAPVSFQQGQGFPNYGRNHYVGLYAQDSWRARPNLTLNYGLRWEFDTPWSELHNEIQTLIPGEQSLVFPGSPTGWVFPGDPGVPAGLGPTRYDDFSPRVGLAYSPSFDSGFLGKLTGGPGKTSIRAGFGRFFTTFEGATNYNAIGDAPFGDYYGSPHPPEFATPYVDRGTGFVEGQKFPDLPPPYDVSAQHPDTSINWTSYTPISSSPGFYYKNDVPYAEQYELAVQRQLSATTLLSLAYVGSQGHKLLTTLEADPSNQALCLSLSQHSEVAPGTQPCGPNNENGPFTLPNGTVIPTARGPFGPLIQSNSWFATLGNSSYNSFQASVRHVTGRLEFLAGYTYSKSLSNASGYGEAVNPLDHNERSLSAFDIPNNFVVSYNYQLPFDKLGGPRRLTQGWRLSGITRFSTGIPVTLLESDDRSLLGTNGSGPSELPIDTPNFSGGKLTFHDPRTGQPYFDTSLFSQETLGVLGTASRRFFHGPGINNWDVVVAKDTRLTEGTSLEIRGEFFNAFNHAQFLLRNNGSYADYADQANFGYVRAANAPRIIQLGAKLLF
ncbi:MAG TPA: TonB-dependent receptor [Terriglobia bacterium]|nr:TonB-dependent receptor [Terriglobia bacterium]